VTFLLGDCGRCRSDYNPVISAPGCGASEADFSGAATEGNCGLTGVRDLCSAGIRAGLLLALACLLTGQAAAATSGLGAPHRVAAPRHATAPHRVNATNASEPGKESVPGPSKFASTVSSPGNLTWHTGPVMHTNTTYAIYWIPAGYSVSANYTGLIDGYFKNLAAASGAVTNVYTASTQYFDATGPVTTQSTFGGSIIDTNPYPASGCTDYVDQTLTTKAAMCLTDAQIQTELNRVITAQGWPRGLTNMYFIFTPKNVGSCFDSGSTTCAYTYYCGYHQYLGSTSSPTIYANEPYDAFVPGACGAPTSPNGDDADSTLSVVSHEHNEAITDPLSTGWYDPSGNENGDKCSWTYGTALGSTTTGSYNQLIGTGKYYLQQEWSNASSSCVLRGPTTAPTATSYSPSSGSPGTSVSISGTSFVGVTSVTFNSAAAAFTAGSWTSITATVPAGATTGPVVVKTQTGSVTVGTFTMAPAPTISTFSPTSGAAGARVSIAGSNLTGASTVKFGGVAATSYTVVSATSITATVPPGAVTGSVSVTTAGGTATSPAAFTVVAVPTISSFSPATGAVGSSVTLTGTALTGASAVKFNGVAATYTVVSATSVTATVPVGATTGKVSVTTPGGTASSSSSFTVVAAPAITSLSPTSGSVGTSVTISGSGLSGTTAVTFNGVKATFKVASTGTSVTTTVPTGATTGSVKVTTPGGTAASSVVFTVK